MFKYAGLYNMIEHLKKCQLKVNTLYKKNCIKLWRPLDSKEYQTLKTYRLRRISDSKEQKTMRYEEATSDLSSSVGVSIKLW